MTITIYPITDEFVAEVGDIDLSKPLDRDDERAVKAAFWKYAVLIFPEQQLSAQQHIDFARLFGPIEADRVLSPERSGGRLDPGFSDISNLDRTGRIWGENSRERMYKAGNRLWHTDSSFKRRPGLCSLLYAHTVVPIGGHTEFADQRAAYDALPPGGAFIVVEALIDDARRENVFGLLMSLNMLIEFGEAFDYSAADFEAWCRNVGFSRFEVIQLAGPSSAAIAYK